MAEFAISLASAKVSPSASTVSAQEAIGAAPIPKSVTAGIRARAEEEAAEKAAKTLADSAADFANVPDIDSEDEGDADHVHAFLFPDSEIAARSVDASGFAEAVEDFEAEQRVLKRGAKEIAEALEE